jgi:hypothetical protein
MNSVSDVAPVITAANEALRRDFPLKPLAIRDALKLAFYRSGDQTAARFARDAPPAAPHRAWKTRELLSEEGVGPV